MNKSILNDYIDACEFIKETETEIKKLEKRIKFVQDKVRGSNSDFPYEQRSFNIEGTTEEPREAGRLQREKQILAVQKEEAEELKLLVEEWMNEIPFKMRRIIKYKFFNDLSWEEVAVLMKAKSGESIRKQFENFMK